LQKSFILFTLLAVVMSGCSGKETIVFRQDNTGNVLNTTGGVYLPGFDVNNSADIDFVYTGEYIYPLDTDLSNIRLVSIIPKRPENRPLKVGFSQMEVNNAWRIYENASIFEEAKRLGVELVYRDAGSSIAKQNRDIIELIGEEVDYLIVAPREYYGLRDALKVARDAQVPVILVDRTTDGEPGVDYVTCIMGDFIEVGQRAARILADLFKNQEIIVFEVTGTTGSSVSRDLSKGFRNVSEPLGWNIISVDGNFDRAASVRPIEEVLQSDKERIQAVFTHVDDSAIAALQAMKAVGMRPGNDLEKGEVPIVSMCGYKDAMKAIIAGEMFATIECTPRFGPVVFNYIRKLEKGEAIPSRIVMPGKTYDATNAQQLIATEGY